MLFLTWCRRVVGALWSWTECSFASHSIQLRFVRTLGAVKSQALPVFHALIGCDTVSCFFEKAKRTAWETWNGFPEATEAFVNLSKASDGSM